MSSFLLNGLEVFLFNLAYLHHWRGEEGLETSYFYFLIGMVWNMLLLPISSFSCHGAVAQSVARLLKVPVLCNSTMGSNHERDRSTLSLG